MKRRRDADPAQRDTSVEPGSFVFFSLGNRKLSFATAELSQRVIRSFGSLRGLDERTFDECFLDDFHSRQHGCRSNVLGLRAAPVRRALKTTAGTTVTLRGGRFPNGV